MQVSGKQFFNINQADNLKKKKNRIIAKNRQQSGEQQPT